MTHRIIRHPLDYSPPRISDLPPDHARIVLAARDDAARDRWMRARQPAGLLARLRQRFLPHRASLSLRAAPRAGTGDPGAGTLFRGRGGEGEAA